VPHFVPTQLKMDSQVEGLVLLEKLAGEDKEKVGIQLYPYSYVVSVLVISEWLLLYFTTQFIHAGINDLCDKNGLQYQDFAKSLSLSEYSKLKLGLFEVLKHLMREKPLKDKMVEMMKGLGVGDEASLVIAKCLWVRKDEIRGQMIQESSSITHSQLTDFDWRLKVCTHFTYIVYIYTDLYS